MAIHEGGNKQNSTSQQPTDVNYSRSFAPAGVFAVPRESGSAYTTKLAENLAKTFLEKRPNIEKEIFVLDKQIEQDINYSCIIVTANIEGNIELGKSFAVLLLASTGSVREERRNIGNEQIEVSVFPSSYFDDYLTRKIRSVVASRSGDVELFNADGFVIPANIGADDLVQLREISKRAEQFVLGELSNSLPNGEILDLSKLPKDVNLIIDVSTNNTPVADSVGEPIRESFIIDFNTTVKDPRAAQQSLHNTQGQKQNVCRVGGYFDLLFGPEDPSSLQLNQFSNSNKPRSTKRYIPRCVITSFDSDSITVPRFLLGLYTTLALQHERNWVQFFRRKIQTGKTPTFDDVGYLNIDANINGETGNHGYGTPIDTSDFSMAKLSDYISAMVSDNLLYSLDCPDGGPESYYTRAFQLASYGNEEAMKYIYDCFDILTGGYFSKEFDSSQPIILQDPIKVLLGHWTDSDGNTRDIRDVDTLIVSNMIGTKNEDPAMIVDWTNIFIPGYYSDEDLRLSKMKGLYNYFLLDTATFTSIATRVNFNPNALVAFSNAIEKCGIVISNIVTPINTSEMYAHRQMFSYDSHAFDQQRSMFRSGGMSNMGSRPFRSGYNPNGGRF